MAATTDTWPDSSLATTRGSSSGWPNEIDTAAAPGCLCDLALIPANLEDLDDRNRAAVAYAAALAEARFRQPIAANLAASVSGYLTPDEMAAVEAIARAMAFAHLSASTAEQLFGRMRSPRFSEGDTH